MALERVGRVLPLQRIDLVAPPRSVSAGRAPAAGGAALLARGPRRGQRRQRADAAPNSAAASQPRR